MDDGEIKGLLKYVSFVNKLEETFKCHVNLVSSGSSNKEFLKSIEKDEVLIYKRNKKSFITLNFTYTY